MTEAISALPLALLATGVIVGIWRVAANQDAKQTPPPSETTTTPAPGTEPAPRRRPRVRA